LPDKGFHLPLQDMFFDAPCKTWAFTRLARQGLPRGRLRGGVSVVKLRRLKPACSSEAFLFVDRLLRRRQARVLMNNARSTNWWTDCAWFACVGATGSETGRMIPTRAALHSWPRSIKAAARHVLLFNDAETTESNNDRRVWVPSVLLVLLVYLHAPRARMVRTCRQADEIELTATHGIIGPSYLLGW